MRYPQVKFGNFQSAASPVDVTVDLGFVPDYVKFINVTGTKIFELFATEGTGKGQRSDTASTYHTFLASGGIELVDTSTIQTSDPVKKTKVQGFKIVAANQTANGYCHWMAVRQS